MNPRLLFVDNDPRTFVSHRLALASAAARAGFDVHVATPHGKGISPILDSGLQHHVINLKRDSVNLCSAGWSAYDLARLYRCLRPQLIHHLRLKPIILGGVAARFERRAAVVNAITGLGYSYSSNTVHARTLRRIMKPALKAALHYPRQMAIFQNPDDRDYCVRNGIATAARSTVILGSGVNTDVFASHPEPPGPPLVVFASRMLWEKGAQEFVSASTELVRDGVKARFALVGGTDPANPSGIPERQLRTWADTTPVEWWGERSDMDAVLRQSAVVCLPTRYREGVPKVLIEAAACGRPVITTDMPGCREIVRDPQNGLLITPGDVAGLAASMKRLIADAPLRKQMGDAGAALVRKSFSIQHVIAATLDVYYSLLRGQHLNN